MLLVSREVLIFKLLELFPKSVSFLCSWLTPFNNRVSRYMMLELFSAKTISGFRLLFSNIPFGFLFFHSRKCWTVTGNWFLGNIYFCFSHPINSLASFYCLKTILCWRFLFPTSHPLYCCFLLPQNYLYIFFNNLFFNWNFFLTKFKKSSAFFFLQPLYILFIWSYICFLIFSYKSMHSSLL